PRDRRFREPHRQAAALAQGAVIGGPIRHSGALLRDVMTAILVRFEWHGDCPGSGTGPSSYTVHLSPPTTDPCNNAAPTTNEVPSATAETAPTKRDRHLQLIAERGRIGWQRASGYNWRALVEADIGRYKRVIGDALRSRTKGRQTTEVAIAVASLNRMLELGRPEY